MANIKISQLPAASTITAGADSVPIVHSGTTEKATPNQIVNEVLKAPGAIGGTTPAAGSFTTLNASGASTINGTSIPTSKTLATTADTQTLTNKTINLANNTVTGTIAEFNTACSDADFVTTSGSATLTNKTINLANNTVSGTIAQFNTACSDADFATLAGAENLSNKTLASTCYLANVKVASGNAFNDANGNEYLKFQSVASAVNEITITNATTGNDPTISSTGSDVDIDLALAAKGAGAIRFNSTASGGNIYGTGAIGSFSSTAGVGYLAGAGGSVTQSPNRTSAVTLNKICGQIITVSATTTAGLVVEFTVNNSTVAATDTVIVNVAGAPSGQYIATATKITAGSFVIQTFTPAAVIGAEALNINFSVIKSVNA